jgi:L-ascorbate metabolism protein UlaG (beta-lactamase superfamily)
LTNKIYSIRIFTGFMKRREFIKKGAVITAGSLLYTNTYAKNLNKEKELPSSIPDPSEWKNDEVNISWIGHSTVLMNIYGTLIITDPVLFERIGLYFFGITFGPARFSAPALEFDQIPRPDLILLSHAHMDHMDFKTLKAFADKYPGEIDCITAYNTSDVIQELKWKSLKEIDWTESLQYRNIHIQALEVKHFGWRFPWERDRSRGYIHNGRSYNAYLLESNGSRIIFGGDTAYTEKFLEAGIKDVDIAIMPIGAYYPWRRNHCTPEEALIMAFDHMKAKTFIPVHCATFKQGMEPVDEPLAWMNEASPEFSMTIGLKNIGETYTLA